MSFSSFLSTLTSGIINSISNNVSKEQEVLENDTSTSTPVMSVERSSSKILTISEKIDIGRKINSGIEIPIELSNKYDITVPRVNYISRRLSLGKLVYSSGGRPKVLDSNSDTILKVQIAALKMNELTEEEYNKKIRSLIRQEYNNSYYRRLSTTNGDKIPKKKLFIPSRTLRRYVQYYNQILL